MTNYPNYVKIEKLKRSERTLNQRRKDLEFAHIQRILTDKPSDSHDQSIVNFNDFNKYLKENYLAHGWELVRNLVQGVEARGLRVLLLLKKTSDTPKVEDVKFVLRTLGTFNNGAGVMSGPSLNLYLENQTADGYDMLDAEYLNTDTNGSNIMYTLVKPVRQAVAAKKNA